MPVAGIAGTASLKKGSCSNGAPCRFICVVLCLLLCGCCYHFRSSRIPSRHPTNLLISSVLLCSSCPKVKIWLSIGHWKVWKSFTESTYRLALLFLAFDGQVGTSEGTTIHQRTSHWMPIMTQLWTNLNGVNIALAIPFSKKYVLHMGR
jgi:hypothetical protein